MFVLFDLDGTLLDTAPDLHAAANELLRLEGMQEVPYEKILPIISFGSSRIVAESFSLDLKKDSAQIELLVQKYITLYSNTNFEKTKAFPGIENLLSYLDTAGYTWGIVTNKMTSLTEPLLKKLNYFHRAACVVSGDTTSRAKPHPEPLNYACKQLNTSSKKCVYIGDAKTDIDAGKAAGMRTIAASFGYIPTGVSVADWQADYIVDNADEILPWIKKWSKEID